ncbi:MAG: hypothetical protein GC159_07500 [Phycisphaera sp.]|nr:hypothetical protein [Phycisphaera sp.]
MKAPLEIAFSNVERSAAVEDNVREHASKLEELYDRITSVRVMVAEPHKSGHKGKLFHVKIEVGVPGEKLMVDRDHHDNHAHEDVFVAIRDAFRAAERQLRDYVDKLHEHGRRAG